jgi:hypothetical protein
MQEAISTAFAHQATYRPTPIDDDLVAVARGALRGVVDAVPSGSVLDRHQAQLLFAAAMATLCADSRAHGIRIEQIIVAAKVAWASIPDTRIRFGDSTPHVLAGVISACIESYFTPDQATRAD